MNATMARSRLMLLLVAALTGNVGAEQAPMPPAKAGGAETAARLQQAIDPATGFIMAENWDLVRANCTVCHSARLITQQRASRRGWTDMIRWMQATQNLWQFDQATEAKILDYLTGNYPPSDTTRRMPIPIQLRPLNPYLPVHNTDEAGAARP